MSNRKELFGIAQFDFWNRPSRREITKYHLYGKEKCRRIRKTLTWGRYKDKTIEFGDLSLQSEAIEYVWKAKGDGKDNATTWTFDNLIEGDSWMSLANSLLRPKGVHGKSKQTSKGGTHDLN
jgi:hypothetical protein